MKKLSSILVVLLALSLALAGCGSKVVPQSGDWEGAVSFELSTGTNVLIVNFTVNEAGDALESWSVFDAATGSVTFGQQTAIENGSFVLDVAQYTGSLNISREFKGTFVASDKVTGTCELDYGNYGSHSGEWEAAPKVVEP